jgi:flagellar biosynthesis protein FliR
MSDVGTLLDKLLLSQESTRNLVTFALVMGRMMPIVVMAPFLGGKNAPESVKMGLGILLSLVILPYIQTMDIPLAPTSAAPFLILMLKEVFIGFCIGFVLLEMFLIADMLGRLVDLLRGTNMATALVPELKERSSVFGDLTFQLFVVIFLSLGGHHYFMAAVFESFRAIPITTMPDFAGDMALFVELIIAGSAHILYVAAGLAMPILVAVFLTDLTFGLLNRTAPQIQAYFLSLPAKAIAGVWLFSLCLATTVRVLAQEGVTVMQSLHEMIQLMR